MSAEFNGDHKTTIVIGESGHPQFLVYYRILNSGMSLMTITVCIKAAYFLI